jgi:hypothetical protein
MAAWPGWWSKCDTGFTTFNAFFRRTPHEFSQKKCGLNSGVTKFYSTDGPKKKVVNPVKAAARDRQLNRITY